ncbi:hypothetical protein HCN44_009140 [Aphidius gifuensis]|uniref:39S ribosomal protein L30, mitochondrial n=1 Tax=Aphidius gifuensis TaxID=684658 RepID=A0A835CVR6_APHGI|nr:hypothetical protein HCN44_009140 [Aphidius gifuensis]
MSALTKLTNAFCLIQTRNYADRRIPKAWKKDVKRYESVNYYPRFPDHEDPPIEPTKLLVVRRCKPYKGNPWWDKQVLDAFKLKDSQGEIAIVKNTPEICSLLWQIKHLIEITPLRAPDKLPEKDGPQSTWLHENGDLLIAPRVDPIREKATIDFINNPKHLDTETLQHELRMRWLNPYDT